MPHVLAQYPVSNLWDVRLHVYVVGYVPEGEAIVFLFTEGERILFSIINDCYRNDELDIVTDILMSFMEPKIDLFIWSHPHDDHSVGIQSLLEKFDPKHNAHIIIPNGIHSLLNLENAEMPESAKNALTYLKNTYCPKGNVCPRRHRNYHLVDIDIDSFHERKYVYELYDINSDSALPVSLSILGPDSILALQNTDGSVNSKFNHLSVVYMLDVNGLKFFMTGDVSDRGAKSISDDWFKDFHFLKIPHHGSDEPKSFFKRIIMNEAGAATAVSTVFLKKKRPVSAILDHYKMALGSVFVTHDIVHMEGNTNKFGCLHAEYSPMNISEEANIVLIGNAIEW